MAAVLPQAEERARKNLRTIFQRLSSVGQARLAEQLSSSETSVSRWKTEQAEYVSKLLAALGLKVIPEEMKCFDPQKIDAILQFARDHVNTITSDSLAWDD